MFIAAGASAQTPTDDCRWYDTARNSFGYLAMAIKCQPNYGGVGIGTLTPAPDVLLHIKEERPGYSSYAAFDRPGTGTNGGFLFRTSGGTATQFFFGKYGPLFNESLVFAYGNLAVSNSALMVLTPTGNVGIGVTNPTTKLDIAGDINVSGNIAAKYQDVAEWVPATNDLAPGTVVVLNRDKGNEVTIASSEYDTAVAGVVSPQPGLILGEAGKGKEMIATTGRVKVKVDATRRPVKVGDLLVTSSKPGFAMVSEPMDVNGRKFHQPGTIIGKALEPLPGGEGEILVLLSMQ